MRVKRAFAQLVRCTCRLDGHFLLNAHCQFGCSLSVAMPTVWMFLVQMLLVAMLGMLSVSVERFWLPEFDSRPLLCGRLSVTSRSPALVSLDPQIKFAGHDAPNLASLPSLGSLSLSLSLSLLLDEGKLLSNFSNSGRTGSLLKGSLRIAEDLEQAWAFRYLVHLSLSKLALYLSSLLSRRALS